MFVHLPVQEILLEKRQAQAVLGDKQARTCHEFPAVSCQQIPCDRHVQLKEDDEESGMLHSKTVQKHGYGMLWVIIQDIQDVLFLRVILGFLTSFIIHFWVTPKVDPTAHFRGHPKLLEQLMQDIR
jgi:hypothetical protein